MALLLLMLIVGRKFVYLRKLTPEAISEPTQTVAAFGKGMVPEIVAVTGKINLREYRVRLTAEFEKILRRIRLLFLKIDDLTHRAIRRLRRSTKHHEAILVQEEQQEEQIAAATPAPTVIDPKEEEQHLIMEIAKNPKDAALYQKLGDIYIKTGEKDNARMSYKTVLDLDPENWYAKKKLEELPE